MSGEIPKGDEDFRLYFNHIPKTGGTSLRLWLEDAFGEGESAGALHFRPDRDLITSEVDKRFFQGHHANSVRFREVPEMRAITWLREPKAWIISVYRYLVQMRDHLENVARSEPFTWTLNAAREMPRDIGFAEFVAAYATAGKMFHGYQTRWLCSDRTPLPVCMRASDYLEGALRELGDYALAGSLSRMQASVDLLCHRLGWPPKRFAEHMNRSATGDVRVTDDALALFAEDNPDFELFETVDSRVCDDFERMADALGVPGATPGSEVLHAAMRDEFCAAPNAVLRQRLLRENAAAFGSGWSRPFLWGERRSRLLRWMGDGPVADAFVPIGDAAPTAVALRVSTYTIWPMEETLAVYVDGLRVPAAQTPVPEDDFPYAELLRIEIPESVRGRRRPFVHLRFEVSDEGMRLAENAASDGVVRTVAVESLSAVP